MFKRSFRSKDRAGKAVKQSRRSFRDQTKAKLQQHLDGASPADKNLSSPVITLVVGRDSRLFACHQDVLSLSPYFAAVLKGKFYESTAKRIELPDEEAEVFSCVLEYLYRGDYYPRLLHDKRRNIYALEGAGADDRYARGTGAPTFHHDGVGGVLLKDSVLYCTAAKFGLDGLKRLALRKQGLRTAMNIDVILRTARFAYDNTPDHDATLRAEFLALIIRSRKTFKRSGTMQMEMEIGGSKLFFDLFVAMCNHVDDIVDLANKRSPRTI